jgi:hypothetical protein
MSILTILLLLVITYYCAKAVGSIWHDAFKGTAPNQGSASRQQRRKESWTQPQEKAHDDSSARKPIEKGEGEYVDFTEEP